MRRKKPFERIILQNIEITEAAAEGKALARHYNMVIFVSNAVPGDVCDIQVTRNKKSFMEGRAIAFHKLSEKRAEPFCVHFGLCGGCKWQHMQYEHQLFYKQKQVVDNFERIAKVEMPKINDIIASEYQTAYRNKLEYTFSDYRWLTDEDMKSPDRESMNMNALGFHIAQHFDRVLDLEHCYLQDEPSNQIRNSVKDFCNENGFTFYNPRRHTGFLRNLLIRNTTLGETLAIMVFGEEHEKHQKMLLEHILQIYPSLTSLMYVVNTKLNDTISDLEIFCYKGQEFITEQLGDLHFRIGPVSFFQTNSRQALRMYDIVKEFAQITPDKLVYDLYTGTGTIANFVARQAKQVIGIEYVASAVEDAKKNSEINDITNTTFIAGDMAKILNEYFIALHGKPDVIITDPPRNGMHPDVVEQILQASPERIVYVSCNPATQARDIALLGEQYKITAIQPLDMFPHTHHVENIVLLEKLL
jgi:23S rRNA (uracil1939-C5)-methyltransferase